MLEVSAREFKLLKYFIEHRGATLSRDELLNEVWGYNAMPSTRTVDVHIAWLRQKLESNPRRPEHIHTIHGLGTSSPDSCVQGPSRSGRTRQRSYAREGRAHESQEPRGHLLAPSSPGLPKAVPRDSRPSCARPVGFR